MKRFLILVSTLAIVLIFMACSSPITATPTPPKPAAPAPAPATSAPAKTTAAPAAPASPSAKPAASPAPTAAPAQVVQWKFGSYWPGPSGHLDALAMVDFANAVKTRSNGRLDIKIYWSGEVGLGTADYLIALKQNKMQLCQTSQGYYTQDLESFRLAVIPGLTRDVAGMKKISDITLPWMNQQLTEKFDSRILWAHPYPFVYIWLKTEVPSVFDLGGKKLRASGVEASKAIKLLNGVPITMPSAEAYEAIMRGTIDGKHGDLSTLEPDKFYEITKFIYMLPLYDSVNLFPMSNAAFNALPKDVQDIVTDEAAKAQAKILKGMEPLEGLGKSAVDQYSIKFGESKGMKFWWPTEADIAKWQKMTQSVWQEYINDATPTGLQNFQKMMQVLGITYDNPKLPK